MFGIKEILMEINSEDGKIIGWVDSITGKIIPNVHGAAVGDDDDSEEDESGDEDDEDESEEEDESEDEDEDDDDGDEEDDDDDDDAPSISQNEMKRIASKEKKDGRKSGEKNILRELGVSSLDEAKRKMSKAKTEPVKKTGKDEDSTSDEDSQEQDAKARKVLKVEGKVMRKLITAGAPDDDRKLNGIMGMLDLEIDDLTDDEDITTAVEELVKDTPALFGKTMAKKKTRTQSSDPGRKGARSQKSADGKADRLMANRHPKVSSKK